MIYELTDHLPKSKSGRKPKDLRRTLSGIKWILKNGGSWRSLPEYFGNWNSVYWYFCRLQDVSIDSSFVRKKTTSSRHQHIGISKGGQTTKIHAVVDALGYPIKFLLSAGNVNDITVDIDDLSTKSKDVADIFVSFVQIHLWSVGKLMNINTVKVTM